MGQARLRGSLEQRQKEGIIKREAEEQSRRKAIAADEAALTPEQREKRKKAGMMLNSVLGIAAAAMQERTDFSRTLYELNTPSATDKRTQQVAISPSEL